MKILSSYLSGRWYAAESDFQTLLNPATEEPLARASSTGADFAAALEHARRAGGPALRAMTFGQRGELLKALAKRLRENRDELLALSQRNNGATAADGSFDVDGGGGALAVYGGLGLALGDRRFLVDGAGEALAKSDAFWSQHVLVPKQGVALHVNAFNFPVWGLCEKLGCALLAGMPVIAKPATATALVAHRAAEIAIESGLLPEGALQVVVGSSGDLVDRLGAQDVLAFTGSAATAQQLRGKRNLLAASVRVNVEADSLNAAVLGPDVEPGSPAFDLFVKDVCREITQKAGQKCTAARRVLLPPATEAAAVAAISARLAKTITGDPALESVRMGPLATAEQLRDTLDGIAELLATCELVHGSGRRIDGVGAPEGRGFFVGPTLLRCAAPLERGPVHHREVFGPVATVLPYDGSAAQAAAIVALAEGTLVTSAYSDDAGWLRQLVEAGGSSTGRLYVGSDGSEGVGSGACFPQSLHGGPGRAGGGEELGGLRGLAPYLQRVALQGRRDLIEAVAVVPGER
jgi:oxepin-CoA hydrolase/3-oxo-5,6-dehydrosuberyl-CoA semialdehyde dehydrogenase